MPKRGSTRRGGGGRGNHKGRIGGGTFNKKKTRGNKRKSPRSYSTQYGELMDDDNVYIPTSMTELASNMGRRKYEQRHLFEEIAYTESHHDDLMLRKLRDRPVEFVKAKEVYDPNIILYKLAKQNRMNEELDVGVQSISLEDSEEDDEQEQPRKTLDEIVKEVQDFSETSESGEDWDEEELNNVISEKLDQFEKAINDMPEEEEVGGDEVLEEEAVPEEESEEEPEEQAEAEPVDELDDKIIEEHQEVTISNTTIEPLDIIIDLPSTKVESFNAKSLILKQRTSSPLEEEPEPEKEEEPEYGFLEEDYEFDVSKIEVSNVRFGLNNQYHLKCLDLTGLNDEFLWIDENEVIDYALSNGVKEHRLKKFLSFITKGMVDEPESESEPEVYISDTDSEEEEDDDEEEMDPDQDDYDYDLDENLEDLIAYSKASTQGLIPFEDRDFSRNTPAKYRRTFDDLDIDEELQESLSRQLQTFKANKKKKKHERDDQRLEEAILRNDMLIKYPVSITIRQIKSEFEQLLKDESRESMSFPTLDTHGHKTIQKLADCYHMSVLKAGKQGVRKYLKIVKNKGTFKNYPNYDLIDKILRGRPIFHRIDKKPQYAKKGEKKNPHKSRGGSSQTRFKEGDIVGAEAPEIGESNLGRQMLQKLGWVQGQGLGVDGNKGINQPIVAKVKITKTGIK